MSGEVKQIEKIKNLATYHDFTWADSIKDKDGKIADFKKINILYGRNYAGKTTLSRIFRAMETGAISEKYQSPEFKVKFNNGTLTTQNSLKNHNQIIRVFNEDFVKENLKFITDSEDAINSFAILGEDNTKIETEIKNNELELGDKENATGLMGALLNAEIKHQEAKTLHEQKEKALEEKLRDKANKAKTGIKHNKLFGDANYNVTKLKADLTAIDSDPSICLTPEDVAKHHETLKEESKSEIPQAKPFSLKYSDFIDKTKALIERKIQASSPIQELLNDAILEAWVRKGREHHEGKKTTCSFCGNTLPQNLWDKLDKHFNKESEELRSQISKLITEIEEEATSAPNLLKFKSSDFYAKFHQELDEIQENFKTEAKNYSNALKSLVSQLKLRDRDIFTTHIFTEQDYAEQDLNSIYTAYERLRTESNLHKSELSVEQNKARTALRLHEVFTFAADTNYAEECKLIEAAASEAASKETLKECAQEKVEEKEKIILDLKLRLKNESKGAEKVNEILNNFFGHQHLSLKAIENPYSTTGEGYRFEVVRDNKKAYHLSEGECSLIAFCYFMARLEDVETRGSQPIIWIDDPISSLDTNHIFFVYSLINANIVTPEKYEENGEQKERDRFKQLFISTHNLDFLKYSKRLPGALSKSKSQYFIISRNTSESNISLMPTYLKDYVTEFNYLFHQIYKCSIAQTENNESHSLFYNFGNNARKFLEAFLYYKYPNAKENDDKLARFFGADKLSTALTDRISNEYSHLAGVFERSITPTDIPEMKSAAIFILKKIKENDHEQYSALLESIGVNIDG